MSSRRGRKSFSLRRESPLLAAWKSISAQSACVSSYVSSQAFIEAIRSVIARFSVLATISFTRFCLSSPVTPIKRPGTTRAAQVRERRHNAANLHPSTANNGGSLAQPSPWHNCRSERNSTLVLFLPIEHRILPMRLGRFMDHGECHEEGFGCLSGCRGGLS